MTLIRIDKSESEELTLHERAETMVSALEPNGHALVIGTPGEREHCSDVLNEIADAKKKLEEERMAITRPLDQAKANVMKLFKPFQDRLSHADQTVRQTIRNYDRDVKRKQDEEQARLRRAALEAAEAELEKKRIAAIDAGDFDTVDELEEVVPVVNEADVMPVVEPPKPKGASTVVTWKHRVIDASKIPIEYMMPNEKLLAALAKSTKGTQPVPGIEFYPDESLRRNRR